MNFTVGCDIEEISKIEKACQKDSFCRRAFSSEELENFSKKKHPYPSMAGAWSAKEAFGKALGTGICGFSLTEITVSHNDLGAPFYKLIGKAAETAKGYSFSLSISHTKSTAMAVCIACKSQNEEEDK